MDERTSPQRLARNDLDRFRLRAFIEELGSDELEVRDGPIDLAEIAAVLHGNRKAVWFRNVNGADMDLVGNVVGSRSRL
ncbi:MAG TPA: UbiD family decarboxylase, partial [Xanthobacteraceae bacterium]